MQDSLTGTELMQAMITQHPEKTNHSMVFAGKKIESNSVLTIQELNEFISLVKNKK